MKKQPVKKLFAFIITIMMLSILTVQANAQKPKGNGHHGGGHDGGTFCNCNVRPIPFECGQLCGSIINKRSANEVLSVSGINSTMISFELMKTQNASLKIYNTAAQLIRTLAAGKLAQGVHEIVWDLNDENGKQVIGGDYFLKLTTGSKVDTKKISVVR